MSGLSEEDFARLRGASRVITTSLPKLSVTQFSATPASETHWSVSMALLDKQGKEIELPNNITLDQLAAAVTLLTGRRFTVAAAPNAIGNQNGKQLLSTDIPEQEVEGITQRLSGLGFRFHGMALHIVSKEEGSPIKPRNAVQPKNRPQSNHAPVDPNELPPTDKIGR